MRLSKGVCVVVLPLVLACGRSRNAAAGASGTGASGTSASGGEDTLGTAGAANGGAATSPSNSGGASGGDPDTSTPIEVRAPATPATCDPALCRVVREAEAHQLDAYEFDDFRLATSSDFTYVTLMGTGAAGNSSSFVALGADGEHPIDQGAVPAMALPLVAVDASGAVHVAGAAGDLDTVGLELEMDAWSAEGWARAAIGRVPSPSSALELEVGQTNAPSLFWADGAQQTWLTTQNSDGAVVASTSLAEAADDYALDAQALPVLLAGSASSYGAFGGGGEEYFTVQVPDEPSNALVQVRAAPAIPQTLPSGTADLALAALVGDGLHVVLASRASGVVADEPIPNTSLPSLECPSDAEITMGQHNGDQCAPPCAAHVVGLAPSSNPAMTESFALARSADGASWLSYVTEDLDGEVTYLLQCPLEAGTCTCTASRPSGPTSWTLHVVRVAPDGSSNTEALTAPIALYVPSSTKATWGVRAHAFEQTVAVALRVTGTSPNPWSGVRVVTFETTE